MILPESRGCLETPLCSNPNSTARLAQDCIKKVEVLDYENLGMEAVWKIEIVDFPAFIIIDDKGNDFYAETSKPLSIGKRSD